MSHKICIGIWVLLAQALIHAEEAPKANPDTSATTAKPGVATPAAASIPASTPVEAKTPATQATAPAPSTARETLDTTSEAPVAVSMTAAADSSKLATANADSAKAAAAKVKEPIFLENARLAHLKVGGFFRGNAYARDISAENDLEKQTSLALDLVRLTFQGDFGDGFGFHNELNFAKGSAGLSLGQVYMQWQRGLFDRVQAGRIIRSFSHEPLLTEAQLPFQHRGRLYQDFLNRVTGYAGYDIGIHFASGFEDGGIPVRYGLGLYNGRASKDPAIGYVNDTWKDSDLKAKDLAFHIEADPVKGLTAEFALSTKTTEDKSNPTDFTLAINTAYVAGLFYTCHGYRLNGEIAYGDNHKGDDAFISEGSANFLAFYVEALARHDYAKTGRWSEVGLKFEGLDPDMGFKSNEGKPNDGEMRFSLAATYGMNANNALALVWGTLMPVTESRSTSDRRLHHDIDLYWRMVF